MTMVYFHTSTNEVRSFSSLEEARRFDCHEYPQLTHEEAVAWASQQQTPSVAHRKAEMSRAMAQTRHWDMMGDDEQAAAWRSYYRELHALKLEPGWPLVEQWPEAPQ